MNFMYREDPEREQESSGFERLLDELQEGDCMVVERFSGAAKSARGFLDMLSELDARGIRFRSVEEHFDTGTEQGRYAVDVLKKVALLDGDYRKARQREGINNAKEEGRYKGRKPIEVDEDVFDSIFEQWRKGEITARQAMAALNLKPNTFYRRVKEKMTDVKNGGDLLNAAKQIGQQIAVGVQAGAEELQDAAEKFAAEYDVDTLSNTVKETLEKNMSAAGKVLEGLSKDFQEAMRKAEAPKPEEPKEEPIIVDGEFEEDSDREWI